VKTLQACADTMCLPLKVDPTPNIYAPSAFTPNGDGKNDHFALVCTHIKTVQLEIFNRWGELIYAGDGVKKGWDGTYQGRPVQADIYVWKALVEDNLKETKRLSGKVALVE
jgi:gliding motility-associated-like protein